jgi:hypothetical protein
MARLKHPIMQVRCRRTAVPGATAFLGKEASALLAQGPCPRLKLAPAGTCGDLWRLCYNKVAAPPANPQGPASPIQTISWWPSSWKKALIC